jgi:hypothetical protein
MCWAVFKDFRGVAYCEPINQGIMVFTKTIPGRKEKRNWLTGKVSLPATPDRELTHIQFDDRFYSRDQYVASAFADAPEGYLPRSDLRYLEENRWGYVKILVFILDDNLGRRMQYEFRRLAPEGELYDLGSGKRDNKAQPHPETDRIIERLRGLVDRENNHPNR